MHTVEVIESARDVAGAGFANAGKVHVGEAEIDLVRHRVLLHGRALRLTPLEWRLLEALLERRPRVLSQAELGQLIGVDGEPVTTASVVAHVYNLRKKLGRYVIETIRGRGVRLRD